MRSKISVGGSMGLRVLDREYTLGTTKPPLVPALKELKRLLLRLDPNKPVKLISSDMSLLKFNKRSKFDSLKDRLNLVYSLTSALPTATRSSCISIVVLKVALPITLNQSVTL